MTAGDNAQPTPGFLRTLQGWVVRQAPCPPLVLRCAESPSERAVAPPDSTTVRLEGCAGTVPHHELLELRVLGAPQVLLDLTGCADPAASHAHLGPLLEQLAALGIETVRLARGSTAGQQTTGEAQVDAAHLPRSRRQALMLETPPELPDGSLPAHVRLRNAVLSLVAAEDGSLGTDSPAVVLGAPGCDTCGVCVRSCPLDALGISEIPAGGDLSITTLVHRPSQCDGCGRCVELCPPQVLSIDGHHSWQLVHDDVGVPVHTLATRRCERCSARLPATAPGRRCVPCEQRHRNPFVSTWPPTAPRR